MSKTPVEISSPALGDHYVVHSNYDDLSILAYFHPRKYMHEIRFILCNFLLRTLQCTESLFFQSFCHWKHEKNITGLAAQMAQKQKSPTAKSPYNAGLGVKTGSKRSLEFKGLHYYGIDGANHKQHFIK